ncbi:MAG: DNA topoisomerase IV subunit A, partial [Pseudomonadota bacterium]
GQGNFGNVDGDNAAAMRYTESRMTDVAAALLEGIDEDTVDFRETYDGSEEEPVVLPANFPNLLANGANGIAVGMATSIPPHNVHELCGAVLHLIKHPNASVDKLVDLVPGPDFPTGGVLVEPPAAIVEAYRTGRGGFRVRARWEREETGRGGYQIVVTEIPFQVQKSRLMEKIGELLNAKKLTLVGDVLDESAEDIRLVIEPKSRTVDPVLLMEQLFKLTDLETRFPFNMNVLSDGRVPNVLGLREVLNEWLAHRRVVLVRRSTWRLGKIETRLEILDGYLIAYLNLDEVIRIVRFEDRPKDELMARFSMTEVQANAILDMRLRALNKLQEVEIETEHKRLTAEKKSLEGLLASDDLQWERIADEVKETRERFGRTTELGRRRSSFDEAPEIDVDLDTVLIEKEPITFILSEKGWVRALKGHQADLSKVQFKAGDKLQRAIHAQTTDKIVLFASNGKFFTLSADKLPGGRGHGEPVKLMVDIDERARIVEAFVHVPGRRLLVASSAGNGFFVPEDEVVALTRKGKQVLNVAGADEATACVPDRGGMVAVIGENRKLLVFPADEVSEMTRGKGMRLQKYKDGGLSDVRVYDVDEGLSWTDSAGRTFNLSDLYDWVGSRAQAGRMAPRGFPKTNRFGPAFGDG